MTIRKFAYSKPAKPFKNRTIASKAGNGVVVVGTKVAQWTVRPGIHAFDAGKGKRK